MNALFLGAEGDKWLRRDITVHYGRDEAAILCHIDRRHGGTMQTQDRLREIALEVVTQGIHTARSNHRIISTIATRSDSQKLARAAMSALDAVGLEIVVRQR
jgi:alpha/beta superfamily hydrolase